MLTDFQRNSIVIHTCKLISGRAASSHSQHAVALCIPYSVKCLTGAQHKWCSNWRSLPLKDNPPTSNAVLRNMACLNSSSSVNSTNIMHS